MNDFHYEVTGAPVIYTNIPPKPHNPLRRPKMNYKKFAVALAVYFVVSVVISVFAALFFLYAGFGYGLDGVWCISAS